MDTLEASDKAVLNFKIQLFQHNDLFQETDIKIS